MSKFEDDLANSISNLLNMCKGISKLTSQNHIKRLEIKSHQRRDFCLYPTRNGGPKSGSGGGRHHLSTLLGLMREDWGKGTNSVP